MILMLISTVAIGVIAGAAADEVLRGRDPRSRRVMAAGFAGAVAGVVLWRAFGSADVLMDGLMALLGAALLAFAVRVRTSAAIARSIP